MVLLPAPLGPMKPNISPASIFRFSPSTAVKSPYVLPKSISSIMGRCCWRDEGLGAGD